MKQKEKKSLASIILPVYNDSESLTDCLKSLLRQTHKQIEIIAIDDHSNDNSYKILHSLRKKDRRLRISRNVKHYGLSVTLNRCIKKVKGSYIAFINARDTSSEHRIASQLAYLLRYPKTAAVGTQCFFINEQKKRIGKSMFPTDHANIVKTLTNDVSIEFESVLINRRLLPRDLLRFERHRYPFLFTNLFGKILTYGSVGNLDKYLYTRTADDMALSSRLKKHLLPSLSVWVKTFILSEYRLPIRSLVFPILKVR